MTIWSLHGLGSAALIASVAASAAAALLALPATERSQRVARHLLAAAAVTLAAATGALALQLVTQDLGSRYVESQSRASTSWLYRLAGLWGGAEGSLLAFTALLALVAVGVAYRRQLGVAAVGVAAVIVALPAITVQVFADPFERQDIPAVRGRGLTPILEHPAMLHHPPVLYLGLVATVVPFLLTIDSAGCRHLSADIRRDGFRWSAGAWTLLTVALATGANWAYVEVGWGGWWAWDPVENSVLVPWLVLTAGLHLRRSRIVTTSDRVCALVLGAPFVLVALGSAVTRSGGLSSVHAFADSTAIGWMLGLLVAGLAGALAVAAVRLKPRPTTASVHAPAQLIDRRDRAVPLLLGLCASLMFAFAGIVLVGVLYPLVVPGEPVVDPSWYNAIALPVGVAVAVGILMATIARRPDGRPPASMWIAHMGLLVFLVGVTGTALSESDRVVLVPGESATVGGHSFTFLSFAVSDGPRPGSEAVIATVHVQGAPRATPVGSAASAGVPAPLTMDAGVISYPDRGVILAETGLHSTPRRDIQVVLRSIDRNGVALFDLAVRPFVMMVWWGAALMALGGLGAVARNTVRAGRPMPRARAVTRQPVPSD